MPELRGGVNGTPEPQHADLPMLEARAVVWARCMGRCELCGLPMSPAEWECHHRQRRGARTGVPLWCPCRLLGLHPRCHNQHRDSVHDNVTRSRASGHLVSSHADPALVPVDLPLGARVGMSNPVTLTCGGTYA